MLLWTFYPPSWLRDYIVPKESIAAFQESDTTLTKDTNNVEITKESDIYRSRPSELKPSREELIRFLNEVSIKYGQDYSKMEATIKGESGFNPIADNGLSAGISQYTLSTWLGNCSKVDDRYDPYKSIDCMGKMWSQGYDYLWVYYCNLYWDEDCINKRGLYPGFLKSQI